MEELLALTHYGNDDSSITLSLSILDIQRKQIKQINPDVDSLSTIEPKQFNEEYKTRMRDQNQKQMDFTA